LLAETLWENKKKSKLKNELKKEKLWIWILANRLENSNKEKYNTFLNLLLIQEITNGNRKLFDILWEYRPNIHIVSNEAVTILKQKIKELYPQEYKWGTLTKSTRSDWTKIFKTGIHELDFWTK